MSLVVVGLDHRRLPESLLQRTALDGTETALLLERVAKSEHVTEVVVLSTCMRTEIYVDAVRFHGAVDDLRRAVADIAGVPLNELTDHLIDRHDESAVRHLFKVTAGLESAVIGESEILGQVARAWSAARDAGTCRSMLGSLFRSAVETGKRVRNETGVGRGTTSIAQAAVTMVEDVIGSLEDRTVLILGAGEMGDGMATAVNLTRSAGRIHVANRTESRASELAERVGADVVSFAELGSVLADSDVVLTSTGSPDAVIELADVERALAQRSGRPIVLVDMAVPHDVAPPVRDLEAVTVLDLTDLERFTDRHRSARQAHVDAAQRIIDEEVTTYLADVSARVMAPLIAALREQFESVRQAELARHPDADADRISRAVVNKVLHGPSIQLKRSAGTPEGERMAAALRQLFGL